MREHMKRVVARVMLVGFLSLSLFSCGGGGGGGEAAAPGGNTGVPDTTAPTASSTSISNGATGVAVNAAISVTFSEPMDASTINATTFTVKSGSTAVPGTVGYSGTTATFTPTANLAFSTSYTATVTTGAKDLAGNALATNYDWNFTCSSSGTTTTAPDPQVPVSGTRQDFMDTSFVAPPGLTQSYLGTDGLVLSGAQTAGQGACAIVILPPRAAEADAMAQAINTVKAFIAPDFNDVIAPWGGWSTPLDSSYISRGVASAGWDYLYFWGYLPGSEQGTTRPKVRILLAQLGAQVVPVIGLEAKDNLCLDDDNSGKPVTWALFYHSLTFTTFTPSTRPSPAQQLLGMWKNNGSTTYNGQTYAANGHYEKLSATQTYSTISPTEVLVTTSTWLGDGSYQIDGDWLTIFPNNGNPPVTNLFRIMEEPNLIVPGGYLPKLYLLQISDIFGVKEPYEFSIVKDLN